MFLRKNALKIKTIKWFYEMIMIHHDSKMFQDVQVGLCFQMFPVTWVQQTNDLEPPDTLQSSVRCVCAIAQLLAPLLHAKPIESDVPWGTLHQTATENRRRGYGTLLPGCWKQSLDLSINIYKLHQDVNWSHFPAPVLWQHKCELLLLQCCRPRPSHEKPGSWGPRPERRAERLGRTHPGCWAILYPWRIRLVLVY